ncbi:MAG: hypothetical protein Q8K89_10330 [Actinomycetota bacterium]|nr:hypothetical protein [Actinomycetota bacterium]
MNQRPESGQASAAGIMRSRSSSSAALVALVLVVAAQAALSWLIVPVFEAMFDDMAAQLPRVTQLVVSLSHGVGLVALLAGVDLLIFAAAHRLARGRQLIAVGLPLGVCSCVTLAVLLTLYLPQFDGVRTLSG